MPRFLWLFIVLLGIMPPYVSAFQTIPVHDLKAAPQLDGSSADWGDIQPVHIPLTKVSEESQSDVTAVSLMAGRYGDSFYLFARWADSSENLIHKPYIWNEAEDRYIRGAEREDRFSIQFEMEGDYTTRWFSGNAFKADMWHWKSSRTNPAGLAHDKMTIISLDPIKRSYKATAENGKIVYLSRPSDQGDKIYTSTRYAAKEKDVMPKYFITENPSGSITDVKAKGVWKDGMWHLELMRKLDTGHADDRAFAPGETVRAGIGIFNASITTDHNISDILVFQF